MHLYLMRMMAVLLVAIVSSGRADELTTKTITYSSSVDATVPLLTDVCFRTDGKKKPLLVVMHGYHGSKANVEQDIHDLAERGMFCVAPDMRGRGESAGRFDCGGLDVHDILDAIMVAVEKYPGEIDTNNINIAGYSGGGGNSFSAFVRFPDLFHVAAPFFGIADYGMHWNPDKDLTTDVGGTPTDKPLEYAARNSIQAAGNNMNTRLHVFWDEEEKQCDPEMDRKFLDFYRRQGGKYATAHVSKKTDPVRWEHGYRSDHPDLAKADEILVEAINEPVPDLSLPKSRSMVVCGYLVTKHFQVFVDDGTRGVVTIRYDLSGDTPSVGVTHNPDKLPFRIVYHSPLAKLGQTSASSTEPAADAELPIDLLSYFSSVDGTGALRADVCYQKDGRKKPLIVVMHGFAGGRQSVTQDIRDFAARGMFAIAPDMRGRYQSQGKFDSGGLDVHDILDAILLAARMYPGEIDTHNINIVGYSGGGGNSFSAFVRFPDLFHVVAPFFGIADYATWYPNNPKQLDGYIGGSPEKLPHEFAARNFILGAGNNPGARLHVFWDEKERMCPPEMNERFLQAYHGAGLTHATAHRSLVTDEVRWEHGYRTNRPDLAKADEIIAQEIFSPLPDLALPKTGELTVCGYVVTRDFQVFVDDGTRGVVKIRYDLTGDKPRVDVIDNPGELPVRIELTSPLAELK